MIFGKTKLELKVGVFVFFGLVILAVFILSIGGFKTWTSGYKIRVTFSFVNGVKIGAPIRIAGMDTGVVKKLNFYFDPVEGRDKVEVICWVKKNVRIPKDSTIWVNTLGLLGEKYLEIMPGKDYNNILLAKDTMAGVDPIPMHEIFKEAKGIIENIDDGITRIKNKEGSLGKLIYDDKIYNELDMLITDVRKNPWKLFFKTKEKK